MEDKKLVDLLVERSRTAQEKFANATQEQVDELVRAICKTIYDNAEELAQMAVEETGMGVYQDKVTKNRTKSKMIWNDLKYKKSVGVLRTFPEKCLTEVAKPMGVVCSVTPCTNPIVTPMSNCAFALKCRNSAIITPHPRAKLCTRKVVGLFREEIRKLGLPEDLVLAVDEPSVNLSSLLMQQADVILATGGMGMVKAAYSSGKPAYGVGAGNVQCIIDKGVNYENAAEKIVIGRTFDNGIICLAEQSVIAPSEDFTQIEKALQEQGVYIINKEEEGNALRKALFPEGGAINRNVVGQPAEKLAELSGISVPVGTKALAVKVDNKDLEDVLRREKMCPVLALFEYKTFEQAIEIALQNLMKEGKGHSAALHTEEEGHIRYAQEMLPVSRLILNQSSGTTGGGSWTNGFTPTTTLGCGTWGNNSISDNFTYTYLMNVTRVGGLRKDVVIPSDEEIWK